MSAALLTPAVQACAFALGCALIYAGRRHAAILTRLLTGAAIAAAALVVIVATMVWAPETRAYPGEMAAYAALAGQPPEAD